MAFQPTASLANRTFVGLITAQFLAGFNDQAIHASAMFFALDTGALDEAKAISLMPILFFAPWAIFCTLAGYFADRYSKTRAIVIWKFSEIIISMLILLGFYMGAELKMVSGAWIALCCVFLMGTHAAFFAPAKYGAMPQILQPHLLSKGNGILESTTFLASILGTVSGGFLSYIFDGREAWIGVILLVLSVIGAVASLMVAELPPSNPNREFPTNLFKPLWDNLKTIFKIRPLMLAVLGIAFFIFMVAYMRATVYMHGQSQNPPWNELKTSIFVAMVAFGVGAGSPLAGNLSGGKVELGLVPVGCLGMIFALVLAAFEIHNNAVLIVSLIIIGFFSGFYMVPLYTLLQQRAPKERKGDIVATSNFVNVVGAISASILFFVLVKLCQLGGVTPAVDQSDVAAGKLEHMILNKHGRPSWLAVQSAGKLNVFKSDPDADGNLDEMMDEKALTLLKEANDNVAVSSFAPGAFAFHGPAPKVGGEVAVSKYRIAEADRFVVRPGSEPLKPHFDLSGLPRFLFLGAALMTLGIMMLLNWNLPDFFVRTLFWYRGLGRYQIKAVGLKNLPTHGPVILAANCATLHQSLQLVSTTDRATTVVLNEDGTPQDVSTILRRVAQKECLVLFEPSTNGQDAGGTSKALDRGRKALASGFLLAVSVAGDGVESTLETFLADLRGQDAVPVMPVYCGSLDAGDAKSQRIRVVFGELHEGAVTVAQLREKLASLGEWVRNNDDAVDVH